MTLLVNQIHTEDDARKAGSQARGRRSQLDIGVLARFVVE